MGKIFGLHRKKAHSDAPGYIYPNPFVAFVGVLLKPYSKVELTLEIRTKLGVHWFSLQHLTL